MAEKETIIGSGNHAALWHGRFKEGPGKEALEFETSIHDDARMVFDDIAGSKAHAAMLGKTGIISENEAQSIAEELDCIADDIRSGTLRIDSGAEDIHSFIEHVLTDRLGETGKKVHTGRSRNDQIALDERLYLRHAVSELCGSISALIAVLGDIASRHTESLVSGYTHMQRAQPVTLAHHLCAWAWMLVRDNERLKDALKRISLSPLGAGALAGSTLPLDRKYTAQLLGFDGETPNSLDSVADRDYCLELASAFAILQGHLSRFCEEIVLWSTEEFRFIRLSEKWSTGSSIMPQKKNPDFAELIRGKTGRVYGDLVSLLTVMKGLPLAYNRDMQEDKHSLFDAYDTVLSCVRVFTGMIESAEWNTEKMKASCHGGHANATDVADYLVRKGMPFRTAHETAAKAVRICLERGCNIEDLPLDVLKTCSPLIDADLYEKITPEACVSGRKTAGGPAAACVRSQIEQLRSYCAGKTCN
ncbi:MAG: argininosuccinate lyase [Bacteroides sp.]|nr:argininosuccinate lyase [Prevotella sp.]MCM1407389.1 argininosuccinate lyase [Treponema brennaborense]MCM1469879.1 argininosuccinate lyase [Bacteroides sp.]